MGVSSYSVHVFVCKCDDCGRLEEVEESPGIYNGAQAVRSLGWSFGQYREVRCDKCRRCYVDKYKNRPRNVVRRKTI